MFKTTLGFKNANLIKILFLTIEPDTAVTLNLERENCEYKKNEYKVIEICMESCKCSKGVFVCRGQGKFQKQD